MRILIILKYHYIGDAVVSLPLIKGVRRKWPEAHVTVLTSHGAMKLLPLDPELAPCTFLPYGPRITKKRTFMDSLRLTWDSFHYAWRERRRGGFDIVFAVHRSFRVGLTAWLCKGKQRVGFKHDGRGFLLTHHILFDRAKQESESTLGLLKLMAPDDDGAPWPNRPVLDFDRKLLAPTATFPPPGDGPLIGIQAGASADSKRWPIERMAALADALIERHGARVILIGGPDERGTTDALLRHMKHPAALDATGEKLPETLGMMAQLGVFIGNDTGLNHLAAAAGSPTVCLFGPTCAEKWGRHYHPHRVVVSPDRTMEGITVEQALSAAEDLLAALSIRGPSPAASEAREKSAPSITCSAGGA
jgi:heptosyltransferase II